MTEPEQATPRDLWNATDTLLNPTRVRLPRDDSPPEWVTLPSLWDQLIEAVASLTGRASTGAQRSRPPCNTDALSLLLEIAYAVRDGCLDAHLKRTCDVPHDLRQVVSHVIGSGDPAALEKSHELIRSWAAQVRLTISNDPDRTWRMHGAACRICGSTTVPTWDDDGQEARQPALIVHSEDGVIDAIICDFCGTTLTGDDLTQLLYAALKRPAVLLNAREALP